MVSDDPGRGFLGLHYHDLRIDLDLSGDLEVVSDDPGRGFLGLHYHDLLKKNYRKFQVKPLPELVMEKRSAKAIIKVHMILSYISKGLSTRNVGVTISKCCIVKISS